MTMPDATRYRIGRQVHELAQRICEVYERAEAEMMAQRAQPFIFDGPRPLGVGDRCRLFGSDGGPHWKSRQNRQSRQP